MSIIELAERYAEKPTVARYEVLMDKILEKEGITLLKEHLFELSYELDIGTINKDYKSLRLLHYDNQEWLKSHELGDEYYSYFFDKHIREEQE